MDVDMNETGGLVGWQLDEHASIRAKKCRVGLINFISMEELR